MCKIELCVDADTKLTHPNAPETIDCCGVSELSHEAVKTGNLGKFPVSAKNDQHHDTV